MMEYRKFTDFTDSFTKDGEEHFIPYEIEQWGTEKLNIERCADGHFSLVVDDQTLDYLNDDLVRKIYDLLGFYLEHHAGSVGSTRKAA